MHILVIRKYEFIYNGCSLFSFFNVQSFNLYTELKLMNVCASFTFISKHKNGEIHRALLTRYLVMFLEMLLLLLFVGDAFLSSISTTQQAAAATRTWTFLMELQQQLEFQHFPGKIVWKRKRNVWKVGWRLSCWRWAVGLLVSVLKLVKF